MHVLTWSGMMLGFTLLLVLGILCVLEDLLDRVPGEAPLPAERHTNIVGTKYDGSRK